MHTVILSVGTLLSMIIIIAFFEIGEQYVHASFVDSAIVMIVSQDKIFNALIDSNEM